MEPGKGMRNIQRFLYEYQRYVERGGGDLKDRSEDEIRMVRDIRAESAGVMGEAVFMMVEDRCRDTKRKAKEQNPGDLFIHRAFLDRAVSVFSHFILC